MSSDNTIVILRTKTQFIREGHTLYNQFKIIDVWRVAHVQGWDNFYWLQEHQPYNVGAYLLEMFKDSKPSYCHKEASERAYALEEELDYQVEYGIQRVDTEYVFYGD